MLFPVFTACCSFQGFDYALGAAPAASTALLTNPNQTFFQTGSAREPYNRGQWGSALRATPQATMGEVTDRAGPADNLYVHVPTVFQPR